MPLKPGTEETRAIATQAVNIRWARHRARSESARAAWAHRAQKNSVQKTDQTVSIAEVAAVQANAKVSRSNIIRKIIVFPSNP